MPIQQACSAARQVVFLMAVAMYITSVSAVAGTCPDHAQRYWQTFRAAALGSNLTAIVDLSYFPFETRGTLDDSPKRQINRQDFIKLFPQLLKTDPGLSPTPTTMKSLLKTSPRLSSSFCNLDANQFRVGTWVFELKPEGWRFIQAFVDE
jgi:hypothetical protein